MDYTGCGNSLNMRHPQTIKLIMDSLRYWVTEMHVDGFRFDLASALARELHEVDRLSAFFDVIHQDPILSRIKLIAEPWDVGDGGYQVGNFPVLWTEWNGKYRDDDAPLVEGRRRAPRHLGYRLTGSSDLYQSSGRRAVASINFITAHDGFTLHDLVSYDHKHNEANGEDNRDGADHNDSWNHGVEGETDDPRDHRAARATEAQPHGHPVHLAGRAHAPGRRRARPHAGRQQQHLLPGQRALVDTTGASTIDAAPCSRSPRRIITLRAEQPVLRRRRFFSGGFVRGSDFKDIVWFRPDGQEMTGEDWAEPHGRALGMLLNGEAIPRPDRAASASSATPCWCS
jgi:glycogen operon protein